MLKFRMMLARWLIGERTEHEDLQKISIDAGTYYIQQRLKSAPIDVQNAALNYVAYGFYMGWRKKEERLNLEKKEITNAPSNPTN